MTRVALTLSLLILCGSVARADPPPATDPADPWQVTFIPYVWAMQVDGSLGVRGLEADLDVSFKDILADLDFALMGAVEARRGRWGILVDGLGAVIKDDATIRRPILTIEADARLREIIVQGMIFYRALEMPFEDLLGRPTGGDSRKLQIDLAAGLRYWNLEAELDLDIPVLGERNFEQETDWVDPVVGTRVLADLTDRLGLTLVGDVGGFGIGSASDFSWELWGLLRYGLSERTSLLVGYRALDIDRSQGDREANVTLHGPILGFSFHF